MPDLSLTVLLLLAWVLLAVSIALVFFVIPSGRRSSLEGELDEDPRTGPGDRRSPSGDRRVGLPDTRAVRSERRRGTPDRRQRTGDRRRGPAAMA